MTKELLREKNIDQVRERRRPKLLGDGDLTVALTVRLDAASKSAMEKVEQAGGTVELPTTSA